MERSSSPVSNTESVTASSPPSSPTHDDVTEIEARKKKNSRKKRKATAGDDGVDAEPIRKHKKPKQRRKQVSTIFFQSLGSFRSLKEEPVYQRMT